MTEPKELARRSAIDFDQFYAQEQAAASTLEKSGNILVLSVDGKGVVMRREDLRPSTQKRAMASQRKLAKRLTPGEKRNSKRMATVAAVYTIASYPRTAQDIISNSPLSSI